MNILIATHRTFPTLGGLERHAYKVAEHITQNTANKVLNLGFAKSNSKIEFIQQIGSNFILGGDFPLPGPAAIKSYWNAISLFKPDVIHTHGRYFASTYIALIYGWIKKVPVVHTEHIEGEISFASKYIQQTVNINDFIIFSIMKRFITRFTAVSNASTDFIKQRFNREAETVHNFIDIDEIQQSNKAAGDRSKILFMYRLVDSKGYKQFIQLAETLPQYDFAIAGKGCGQKLAQEAATNSDNLEFLGELSHRKALKQLSNCDILINLSIQEGLSTTILEAKYMGKKILATNIPSNIEVLDGYDNCLLTPSWKTLKGEEFIKNTSIMLKELINKKEVKQEEEFQFTLEKSAAKYLKIYQDLYSGNN